MRVVPRGNEQIIGADGHGTNKPGYKQHDNDQDELSV
jgi:hypothetical protein